MASLGLQLLMPMLISQLAPALVRAVRHQRYRLQLPLLLGRLDTTSPHHHLLLLLRGDMLLEIPMLVSRIADATSVTVVTAVTATIVTAVTI